MDIKNLVKIKQSPRAANLYQVGLNLDGIDFNFDQVNLSLFIYPYSRRANADSFVILPYEEYVNDLVAEKRTSYRPISSNEGNIVGIGLGLLIVLIFLWLKPEDLFSVQSIVSIFGAFMIGKELWDDIDRGLVELTAGLKGRWREREFYYAKEVDVTMSQMQQWAREKRYETRIRLAEEMDFVTHSNSKLIDLSWPIKYRQKDEFEVLLINFHRRTFTMINNQGFMMGVKVTFVRDYWFWKKKWEFFQSWENGQIGVVDNKKWLPKMMLWKVATEFYRIKIDWWRGIKKMKMISWEK